ncbi:vanadium-dependent haloperoxidase [Kibdelosporangium philippinense]|uniref:Vanadium-dependent haloperoxidase n=1 Tax=Kibdelosporangium philippinense TaxID=211113 RepID=A0ABS8ZGK8_9PSEU|nr:vanadium-dependent haloperoxidase [Kibdelosporangium philippinense]MCE7006964.1 vanadium-dependent haloperoxidase [Kibdelosporangium philippinense]
MPTRVFIRGWLVAAATVTAITTTASGLPATSMSHAVTSASTDSVVVRWNQTLLQAIRTGTLGPPMVARALAIVHTCAYDAWAAYDDKAAGTRLGGHLRRPPHERTLANKNEAISFAAYRAAVDLYPASSPQFADLMRHLGYDPQHTPTDPTSPAGVGVTACAAVLSFRHHDGANQLGDLAPGPYADYTGYHPVNAPMTVAAPIDPATVRDPNKWQPLVFPDQSGRQVTQSFLAPHWSKVVPFALKSGDELRSPTGPAIFDKKAYERQAREMLTISANLTDRHKATAEYWADGPRSETPPGHWCLFAQFVSQRDGNTLDADVKLFFTVTNALLDASIGAWDNKRFYDSVRPITAVRLLFRGQQVRAWAGPGLGTRTIDGGTWKPYQPTFFPTPPFAEFTSGHSTFSAAAAEVLKAFTHSDRFGLTATIRAGSSKVEPEITPGTDVALSWPTFSTAADEAGISRRYGGIHLEEGDEEARKLGQQTGRRAWTKAHQLFQGHGTP